MEGGCRPRVLVAGEGWGGGGLVGSSKRARSGKGWVRAWLAVPRGGSKGFGSGGGGGRGTDPRDGAKFRNWEGGG